MSNSRRRRYVEGYVGASTWPALIAGERTRLTDGTFALDCFQITLEQCEPPDPDNPKRFSGPGSIRQLAEGGFEVVIYSPAAVERYQRWRPPPRERAGLIPRWCYFRLEATDLSGRRWTASHLLPSAYPVDDVRGAVVRCRFRRLACEQLLDRHEGERDYLRIEVFDRFHFPANVFEETTKHIETMPRGSDSRRNTALFRAGDLTFHVVQSTDDLIEISCVAEEGERLPAELLRRVIEALQFTFGRTIHWSVATEVRGNQAVVQIADWHGPEDVHSIGSPLDGTFYDDFDAVWGLFSAYLAYVLPYELQRMHPVSDYWDDILRVSSESFETRTLVYVTATEGLAKFIKPPAREDRAEVKTWHERMLALLADQGCPEPTRKRFERTFEAMLQPSPRDAMEWLAGRGLVLKPDVGAWKALRPKAAHGGRAGERHEEIDETVHLAWKVRRLASWIVFAIIGYDRPGGTNDPQPVVGSPYRYAQLRIDDGHLAEMASMTREVQTDSVADGSTD